jgi:hypothetical protein
MNKTEVLSKAADAISAVEQKLTALEKLNADTQAITESVETLKESESTILAGDQSEEQKVKSLLKLRAILDVKSAALEKAKSEAAALTSETIESGARCNLWLGAIRDSVVPFRKARIGAELKALFIPQAALEVDRLLDFSLAVRELAQVDALYFSANRMEQSLSSCRKLRGVFGILSGAAEAETELVEVIAGDW